MIQAAAALKELRLLLNPPRKKGPGHIDPEIDIFVRTQIEGMQATLNLFTNKVSTTYGKWRASSSSLQAAISLSRGSHCARRLRCLVRQFIMDRKILPINPFGSWNQSMLLDENLVNEINIYLQSIDSEISGEKLMDFLADEDLQSRHGIEKPIKLRTAQHYLNVLVYRFKAPAKGQYVDGHEREDVVIYREQIFLPQWRKISERMFNWVNGDIPGPESRLPLSGRPIIAWFHDESIFYSNDR